MTSDLLKLLEASVFFKEYTYFNSNNLKGQGQGN